MTNEPAKTESNQGSLLKFLIPSLIGIALFMTPIPAEAGVTIPIALLSEALEGALYDWLPAMMTGLIAASFLGTVIQKGFRPHVMNQSAFFSNLFDVGPFWLTIRLLATIFAVLTLFQIGPEMIYHPNTGGLLLEGLLPLLFSIFFFAGLFLPLLLNFGLLEFFGSLLTKIMRPLFTLPGRSSIDSLASWLGDGTIGVIMTNKQYEEGFYSKREAAVIGTTFSVVSITFSLVVISEVGLEHMFLPFYFTVIVAGVIAALIMPRIPPLSKKPQAYADGKERDTDEALPKEYASQSFGAAKFGLQLAKKRAAENTSVPAFFKSGSKNVLDMWLGVAPVVMAFGTAALIIAENTPVFTYIGMPFVPLLELMQVPEAGAAAETLIVGFADMFLPAIFASGIESEMTRFIIACVSVSQLIYLSEVGGVILGSKIPLNLGELFIIFIERTLITLPIIVLIAHMIF
ncbi:YjiH family protein [Salisediminibacterium halotolerans]|uniref:Nucleoside recognition GATE domain-containing membrane protein YjiH n=1 Tax=Salisediminibacterium halotolerans TaxID=517425 RepID=A0A1H9W8E0_9BACI|nr:YjiH family protein [Salisediminibacterium haloalkalitolerans]SES30182.1 nucleoside recognition GATE domain-containing membrane protein YjiH [Salisediminibacterium haloalkalitolerans]